MSIVTRLESLTHRLGAPDLPRLSGYESRYGGLSVFSAVSESRLAAPRIAGGQAVYDSSECTLEITGSHRRFDCVGPYNQKEMSTRKSIRLAGYVLRIQDLAKL